VPELPDITLYLDALAPRVLGHALLSVEVVSPFVLRSVDPPLETSHGKRVTALRRIGKRIVIALEDQLFLVIHLMIAGRLQWRAGAAKLARRTLATFVFDAGTLILTEAGTTRRASLYLVRGEAALAAFDRGGLEVLEADADTFAARLRLENHTVKRALADPRLFSGIGNAYSDEILHRARLSPMLLTARMTVEQVARLFEATRATLREWTERLRREAGGGFPEKVTAFRDGMAVHGRFRLPCPACGEPVQRIRYADNETNYCARCQTGGKLLADRGLSRLLKDDWPRSLDELDELLGGSTASRPPRPSLPDPDPA
jgi:formamidopyrimidine-DNA glycosylase